MKELQTFAGQTYEATYLGCIDISNISPLWQVYGFFFDKENNLLINDDGKGNWRLPGGKIEEGEDWKTAIIREALEEADVVLEEDSVKIFGVIEMIPKSENCEKPKHYLLRCSGKIKEVKEQTPDPDLNLICQRKFINTKDFPKYIKWGNFGEHIKEEAIRSLK
ncbi:MAG: NUDIX hydrolase [Nanoarchaeota archaeon]|jgi:ADP-ribose pyrophosphatase YjhB (NUDIX family)|nr:NUDIX hydrolase [Nanoarchaeota archaeon]